MLALALVPLRAVLNAPSFRKIFPKTWKLFPKAWKPKTENLDFGLQEEKKGFQKQTWKGLEPKILERITSELVETTGN